MFELDTLSTCRRHAGAAATSQAGPVCSLLKKYMIPEPVAGGYCRGCAAGAEKRRLGGQLDMTCAIR